MRRTPPKGHPPTAPETIRVEALIPADLVRAMDERAESEDRTRTAWLTRAIRAALKAPSA